MNSFKLIRAFGLIAILVLAISSCKDDGATTIIDDGGNNTVVTDTVIEVTTDHGVMILYMYKGTPLHRHNFHKLASEGFYDDTEFHRIIPGFMIQGGDPNSKDADRTNDGFGGPGYTIPAEIDKSKYTHITGAVAAARLGDAQNPQRASSGSQFYISVDGAGTAQLDGAYTVFGQVIQGDAMHKIVSQPRNGNNLPNVRIKMSMKILEKTKQEIMDDYGFEAE